MGNCKSESMSLQSSNANFFTQCNAKPVPKAEDIFLNIVKIQSIVRGYITRKKFSSLLDTSKEQKLTQNLHNYARQILFSRHLPYDVFNYSKNQPPNEKPKNISIKKLETIDSKIKYYGQWLYSFWSYNCLKTFRF